MPFNPNEFQLGETDKIVTFSPKKHAPGNWTIRSVRIKYANIGCKRDRWSLVDVADGPADTKQATLHFDDQGFDNSNDPLDYYLRYFWQNGTTAEQRTLVFDVSLDDKISKELLVTLLP